MFRDFKRRPRPLGLFVLSLLAASSVFGGVAVALVRQHQSLALRPPPEPEQEVEVEFAPLPEEPEPEPEPIVEPAAATLRPAPPVVVAPAPPEEIPDETAEESQAELEPTTVSGPVGGDIRGTATAMAPTAPVVAPPEPPPAPTMRERRRPRVSTEEVTRPRIVSGPRSPAVPAQARSQGIQGVVLVRVIIDEEGRLRRYEFVRGPDVFHDAVRTWLRAVRFSPARLADGSPTAWTGVIPARFNARNL